MDRIGKGLVVGGVVLAVAGGIVGKINGNSARALVNDSVRQMRAEGARAADAQGSLPLLGDRVVLQGYVPQAQRYDYSASAAHNPDFQAFEKAEADMKSGWEMSKKLSSRPEVQPYLHASNNSFLGYLAGMAGLGLAFLGARKDAILLRLERGY